MQDLQGRVAFITGGARGIGLGVARACAQAGVRVALADLDADALAAAQEELSAVTDVSVQRLDVTDRVAYARTAERVTRELGEVSLLFNNAGVADSTSPSRMSHDLYDWIRAVNVDAVHNGLHAFLPGMVARRDGHIVNTASEAGFVPGGAGFLYCTTKYAVVGMSESLREELSPLGIGVSVLAPGPVATTIVENTRARRPGTAPAHSDRVRSILDASHSHLLDHGRSPDDVGALVLDAVQADRAYVFTRNQLASALRERSESLSQAMDHAQTFLDQREHDSVR